MLIYTGKGKFIIGVPARDLTDDEVRLFDEAQLLASGLYVRPSRKLATHEDRDNKMIMPETEDKSDD